MATDSRIGLLEDLRKARDMQWEAFEAKHATDAQGASAMWRCWERTTARIVELEAELGGSVDEATEEEYIAMLEDELLEWPDDHLLLAVKVYNERHETRLRLVK